MPSGAWVCERLTRAETTRSATESIDDARIAGRLNPAQVACGNGSLVSTRRICNTFSTSSAIPRPGERFLRSPSLNSVSYETAANIREDSPWKFLLPITSIKDPEHQCDHYKHHPAGLGTEQAARKPLRALPAGVKKMADGILAGVLSRPH